MVEPTTSLRPPGFDESVLSGYFVREERTLSYQGAFSVRLTEREMQGARVRVIVAPSYYPRTPYSNKGFNPRKTVSARYTAWQQDSGIIRDGYVSYEPTIVMDYRNEGAITRRWSSILMKASLQAMNSVQLAAIEAFPAGGLAWAAAYVVSSNVRNLELQTLFADEPCIGTGEIVGSQAVFWTPAFAPPETMWKFVPDFEGIWHFIRIECWYFRECQTIQVAQPSSPDEEENSDSGSQLNPPPTGGTPPPPETEDERDPRNDPDDYSTAPPFEPEEPPPFFVSRYPVTVTFANGTNFTTTTGCNWGSNPPAQGVVIGDGDFNGGFVRGVDSSGQPLEERYGSGSTGNPVTGVSVGGPIPC